MSLSQQAGSGQIRFRTQELEEVGSQAAAAKGTLLSAVADQDCRDQWISENAYTPIMI
jgi:hypothetical protein